MGLLKSQLHERILGKKQRLDALRPLPASAVRKIQQQMRIQYIYNSNAIEGNTLTLRETQLVLEEGITVGGKPLHEILEAKNHPEAINYIESVKDRQDLREIDIFTLHRIIVRDIIEKAGRYRTTEVKITGTDYIPPPAYEVPFLIRDMIDKYNRNPDEYLPIELAAWLHHKFVHIHPFRDGNGRVTRLLMNLTLLRHGYPIAVILRTDRKRYYDNLRKADRGNLVPFVNFVASAVEQSLDLYLRAVEPTEDELLTVSEASKGTRFSAEYLSLLARTRRIAAIKVGRRWMIPKRALERYIAEQSKATAS